MGQSNTAVKVLIGLNVLFFIPTQLSHELDDAMVGTLALFFPQNPHFKYWQVVTTMFMHGGFAHLFFNMFALSAVCSSRSGGIRNSFYSTLPPASVRA